MFTLASSAFGIPGARNAVGALNGRRSVADDSISHFSGAAGVGDSTSHFLGELEDDERLLEALDHDGDVDASVRALRPRSSRRGSWESEASGWSAHFGNGTGPPGTPSVLRDRSLWTSASLRTGTRSVNWTEEEMSQEKSVNGHSDGNSPGGKSEEDRGEDEGDSVPPLVDEVHGTPTASTVNGDVTGNRTPKEKGLDTPKVSSLTLEDGTPPLPSAVDYQTIDDDSLPTPNQGDRRSVLTATTDAHTDMFVSAPSTPLPV